MLRQLKQLVIFLYLLFWRKKCRDKTLRTLTSHTKRRRYIFDIPEVPAVLDEITKVPSKYEDILRFSGFDRNGACVHVELDRNQNAKSVRLDLEIPGLGHFSYEESRKERNDILNDFGCKNIGCGKLSVYNHQPMRRWKLYFRGCLHHTNENGKRTHARIMLYWQCLSDPYDLFASQSCWKLANSLSSHSLREICKLCHPDFIWFQQWGELRGNIEIEGHEEVPLRLRCMKDRVYKPVSQNDIKIRRSKYIVQDDSGLALVSNDVRIGNDGYLNLGFITFPIGDSHPSNVVVQKSGSSSTESKISEISEACNNTYIIQDQKRRVVLNQDGSTIAFKRSSVNDKTAYGLETLYNERETKSLTANGNQSKQTNVIISKDISITGLDEGICKDRNLVGGKACQLAFLRSMKTLNVPKGICLTVNTLTKHIAENEKLSKSIESLSKSPGGRSLDKLKQNCEEAINTFLKIPLRDKIQQEIEQHMNKIFGETKWMHMKFAVRSSSLSEDGGDSSSAGQMDTFLSVQGLEDLVDAVQRCWASSLSFQVVEYRRQNGQPLVESMGVIIQEMVDADVSGVLFTNDPVNGDDYKMVVNAAYGVGELVVSGRVNPDTIIVKRGSNDTIQVETTIPGEKEANMGHNSDNEENLHDLSKHELCLTNDEILLICNKGLQIEERFECGQDIEWAISNGTLYILQTRPITSLDIENDDELLHEFDSPVVNDNMLITPANIQEMMPGAVSTLTADLFVNACDRALKYAISGVLGLKGPVHAAIATFVFSGLPFLSMTPLAAVLINYIGGTKSKPDFELYIFGQNVKEHSFETVKKHYGRDGSLWLKAKKIFATFVLRNRKDLGIFDKLQKKSHVFKIDENISTAADLYELIDGNLSEYFEMWRVYLVKSSESSTWSSLIMKLLKGKSNEMSVENLADVALILSECKDVYSAEVPSAVASLAQAISASGVKEEFLNTPDDIGDEFLKKVQDTNVKDKYKSFLARHGHSCIREAELIEKSWAQAPATLMKALKSVIKNNAETPKSHGKTVDDIVDGLKTPLSWTKKMILKYFLIEKAMYGVRCRELGKSVTIKFCTIFKEAYWRLAELMVDENRLPDERLLFFLTHAEIGELIQSRRTGLVKLAKRRMKIFPEMMDTRFPKINIGVPKPLKKVSEKDIPAVFTLRGMPVSRGKTRGRACVIKSLQDASQIEEGDILICRYTDVGWSPYFPMISGLVTEMGGLLSHGSVVARECGIPCVVNIPDATDMLHTGDIVVLNGTDGTLDKI